MDAEEAWEFMSDHPYLEFKLIDIAIGRTEAETISLSIIMELRGFPAFKTKFDQS